jgi:RimJ/RimL family protein N-acetyltransferase
VLLRPTPPTAPPTPISTLTPIDRSPLTSMPHRRNRRAQAPHLAPLDDSGLRQLVRQATDPELLESMCWSRPFDADDPAEVAAFVEAIAVHVLPESKPSPPVLLGVHLPSRLPPIGYVALKGGNPALGSYEIGFAIVDPAERRRGYGRPVITMAVDYAFAELGARRLWAVQLTDNHASLNLGRRLGFWGRERLPAAWPMPDGSLADMLWVEMTRDVWAARRPSSAVAP